jgi:hypothetical protein
MLGFDWADGGGLTFFLGPQHVPLEAPARRASQLRDPGAPVSASTIDWGDRLLHASRAYS